MKTYRNFLAAITVILGSVFFNHSVKANHGADGSDLISLSQQVRLTSPLVGPSAKEQAFAKASRRNLDRVWLDSLRGDDRLCSVVHPRGGYAVLSQKLYPWHERGLGDDWLYALDRYRVA